MPNAYPVILVHGLFGWGPSELAEFPYWGTGMSVPSPLPRYAATVGPVSSLHDRACELAWQIRGGRVDYGADHSAQFRHQRYGRRYDRGIHPNWSAQDPVHLVGHSMGAPTIFVLQQLLADDFFDWGSTASWVASINSISGSLNGSTATYYFGCDPTTGQLDPDTAGDFLAHTIELFVRVTGGVFDRFYDFQLDQWGVGTDETESLDSYVARIAESPMFTGKDNGAYDLTLQSMLEVNGRCRTNPNCFYFSFVTEQTFRTFLSAHYFPEPDMNPFLIPPSVYIGKTEFRPPLYQGFTSSEWWENDGLVSTYSQSHPRIAGTHPVHGVLPATGPFQPGGWYTQVLAGVDHIDIVALPQLNQIGQQKRFYMNLFSRLADLPG